MNQKETPAGKPPRTGAGEALCDSVPNHTENRTNALEATLERIAADDRRWFERHPRKRWRIRPPLPGEYPCGPQMAVCQMAPEARMRFAVFADVPPRLTDRGVEYFMRAVLPDEHVRKLDEFQAALAEAGQ